MVKEVVQFSGSSGTSCCGSGTSAISNHADIILSPTIDIDIEVQMAFSSFKIPHLDCLILPS